MLDVLALDLSTAGKRVLDMASSSDAGGSRRGAERKRKFDVAQGRRTVAIRLEMSIYERWVEFKNRVQLKTNCTVAKYLLNVADAFDEQPSR